jgi:two-component system, chemotaxis family, protein-glutamate methylesterase/glutaminase
MVLPSATLAVSEAPIRVMIIDDSAVVRGLVTRWLREQGDFELVSSCSSGEDALRKLDQADPDVVLLDIEMPGMSGVEVLPLLLEKRPGLPVIVASTLTRRNAELSMKCLSLGAADCLAKPSTDNAKMVTADDFKRDLMARARSLGSRTRRRRAYAGSKTGVAVSAAPRPAPLARPAHAPKSLRPFSRVPPRVLLIGSSTGGPQALATVIDGIKPVIGKLPVLITQHMPVGFTTILAEHLHRISGFPSREPEHGEPVKPGQIFVAPGGKHMRLAEADGHATVSLSEDPPVNYCRPAVDPLFQSAIKMYGAGILSVVLTGMGADGARGAVEIADAGGSVIAQDEATSVVWGMPGATVSMGAAAAVEPLENIAGLIRRLVMGERV